MPKLRMFLLYSLLSAIACTTASAGTSCPVPFLTWGSTGAAPGQFVQPFGVEVAADGYVYVADQINERVQVFTDTGDPITSWAIPPGPNGFAYPTGICVRDGVVWVSANQGQHVTRWTTSGTLLGYAAAPPGGWAYPTSIAADAAGDILVCNSYYNEVIRLNSSGAYLGGFATGGAPYGIDIDAAGNIYVGCYGSDNVVKHSPTGAFLLSWGGTGSGPGQFNSAEGLAHDALGDIYVCDTGNDRIQKFTSSGAFLCEFGGLGTTLGLMDIPSDLSIASNGEIFVCEYGNNRIQRFTLGVVPTSSTSWGSIKAHYR